MNRRVRLAAGLFGLLWLYMCVTPMPAMAQTGSATSIVGQVKDENGGALPGVTATLTGPALQVPQMVAVTDSQGDYRITPLPIGTFTLQFELSGFQILKLEGITLTSGFTATLNEVLKIGSMSETITVSGQSPLVDVTQATTATSLQGDSLALLPSGNNGIVGFLQQVPGVRTNIDVGGSSITDTNLFATNGQSGEQWPMLEGVFAATSVNSASGTHYDFNAVEEGRFQTSANQVDNPMRGVGINLVMKSGGNAYHGLGEFSDTNYHFQSSNISDVLRKQGVVGIPKLFTRRDEGGQLGGKVIQDKLWFFADWRYRTVDNEIPFAINDMGGGVVTRPQHQFFQVYKLSNQLDENNRIILFWHRYGDSDKRGASQFVPASSMVENDSWGETWKAEWQTTRGKWLTFSAQWGHFNQVNSYHGFNQGHPATIDIVTQMQTGDTTQEGSWSWGGEEQGRAAATIYKTDLGGNHVINIGYNHFFERNFGRQPSRDDFGDGNYQLRYNNSAAYQITFYNYPNNPSTRVNYWALYAQDTWTIGHRLTLNPGFRGQRDHGWVPSQCQLPGVNQQAFPVNCLPRRDQPVLVTYSPRIYAAFDVNGDGKSVIKGGYGRFVHLLDPGGIISQLNANGNRNMTFVWHDSNNDLAYQAGEVNMDPTGPDYASGGSQTQSFINPNLKAPWSDQFSIGFERQLMRLLAARVQFSYDRNFNVQKTFNPLIPWSAYTIPITSPDPGNDGLAGTADDPGTTLTYYDYGPEYRGAQFAAIEVEDPNPKYNNQYKTIEFSMTKRLSDRWQLLGSYSYTKDHNPFPGSGNPNTQLNAADDTSQWIGKLSGSYVLPQGILAGASYNIRNGAHLARQVLLQGGRQITSVTVNAGLPGTLNLPNVPVLDLRLSKRFRFQDGWIFDTRLDCFNSLNASPVQSIVTRAGSTFAQATASAGGGQNGTGLTPPRLFQLGGVFSF